MPRSLVIRAGARAAARLREEGFHAELFDTLVGASGGPKWLVLRHLDDVLIDRVVLRRTTPLDTPRLVDRELPPRLLRAARSPRGARALRRGRTSEQTYHGSPDARGDLATRASGSSRISSRIAARSEIVSNPLVRSHFVAARLRHDRGLDRGAGFQLQLAGSRFLEHPVPAPARPLLRAHRLRADRPDEPTVAFDDLPTHYARLEPAERPQGAAGQRLDPARDVGRARRPRRPGNALRRRDRRLPLRLRLPATTGPRPLPPFLRSDHAGLVRQGPALAKAPRAGPRGRRDDRALGRVHRRAAGQEGARIGTIS